MSADVGPAHDPGCPTRYSRESRCGCTRTTWLDERVPRARARAEVLDQLATWAGEQASFADNALRSDPDGAPLTGVPGWRQAAARAGAVMAQEVYVGVRRTALHLGAEARGRPAHGACPLALAWTDRGEGT